MSVRYWLASFRVDDARTAVAQAAEAGPGYVPLRLRNHVEEVRTGDIVFFWVVGEHGEEGLFAVGRVFAHPGAGNLYAVSTVQWRVLINALEPRTPGSGWPRGAPH